MSHGVDPPGDALPYLLRDPLANRELLLVLQYEAPSELRIVRRDGAVAGVLIRGPGPLAPDPSWVRIEADDPAALDQLLALSPPRRGRSYAMHRDWIARTLIERYGAAPTEQGVLGFALGRAHAPSPSDDPSVRLLTIADLPLVERSACGWSRRYFAQLVADDRRPWAMVAEDMIVARASTGYLSGGCEEVVGVWTHPRWRNRGLARRLVRDVASDILSRYPYATYSTTINNVASQHVARAVGFEPTYEARLYLIRG